MNFESFVVVVVVVVVVQVEPKRTLLMSQSAAFSSKSWQGAAFDETQSRKRSSDAILLNLCTVLNRGPWVQEHFAWQCVSQVSLFCRNKSFHCTNLGSTTVIYGTDEHLKWDKVGILTTVKLHSASNNTGVSRLWLHIHWELWCEFTRKRVVRISWS